MDETFYDRSRALERRLTSVKQNQQCRCEASVRDECHDAHRFLQIESVSRRKLGDEFDLEEVSGVRHD